MERETRSQSVEHVWCAKPPLSRLPLFKIDVLIPILQMKQLRLSKVKSPIQGRSANLPQNEDFNSSLMIQKPGSEAAAVNRQGQKWRWPQWIQRAADVQAQQGNDRPSKHC